VRLGILGGTFNPIHLGHLRLAEELVAWLALDRILFIPAGLPPLRPAERVASALHRYTMVALAIAGRPRFFLSDAECGRPGPSYSVETVEEVRAGVGESARLFFILGSDAFLRFPEWREPQRLLKQTALVLVPRGAQALDPGAKDVAPIHVLLGRPRWVTLVSRSQGTSLEPGDVGVARVTSLPISAREIRRRVRVGESIQGMVPATVEEYIQKHRLYREEPARSV
jgi:nicotinate-nucleotide adenylyltransferase